MGIQEKKITDWITHSRLRSHQGHMVCRFAPTVQFRSLSPTLPRLSLHVTIAYSFISLQLLLTYIFLATSRSPASLPTLSGILFHFLSSKFFLGWQSGEQNNVANKRNRRWKEWENDERDTEKKKKRGEEVGIVYNTGLTWAMVLRYTHPDINH